VSDDRKISIVSERNDELMHHKSKDSQLGGTSVVELDGTLGELLVLIKGIPSEVNVSVTEVTDEFVTGVRNVSHEGALEESNESDHLDNSGGRNGIRSDNGGNTVRVRCEGVTGVVNVSWEVDSGTGNDLSEECKLTDTSVLDLDVTETVETLLVGSGEHTHWVPKSERGLGTEGIIEGVEGSHRRLLGGRSKGNSTGKEGGKDGKFHFEVYDWFQDVKL
jgi:hypothetical protein